MISEILPRTLGLGSGAGSRLPTAVLVLAGVSTFVAVLVSVMSIYLQLKNYRKPGLQRMVVRIMLMVPIYGISSLISLFSLDAAVVIDAVRDIYEAFVIYCFFVLLLLYLGGERSLLILLHGRPPKEPVFPASLFKREIDVSDPHTFLFLKRGILQYVQVKPVLALATLILKAVGKFNEGDFRLDSGYLYVSIIYNISICLALYCLAMFWLCVNEDLRPFRPVPKFLCVKGILFFSFWQAIGISILVSTGVIRKLGPYQDREHISLGLTDTLICIEMPFFAIAHMFAFSYTDFIDASRSYVARMPFYYAFRDAFGILDVVEDSKATLQGEGMDYREFEPSEGFIHQGIGRERRIRAGLRYSKGGKKKYWLPRPTEGTRPSGRIERGVNGAITRTMGGEEAEEVHAPLLQGSDVVHLAPDMQEPMEEGIWSNPNIDDGYELPFGDIDESDEELFAHSKRYLFGDYNYPCIDVSSEAARTTMWDEEERVLRDERGAWFSPIRGSKGQAALEQRDGPVWEGYGAVGRTQRTDSDLVKGKAKYGVKVVLEDDRLIDYEQDRTPALDSGDVKLNWTHLHRSSHRSRDMYPRNYSLHAESPGSSSAGPSSAGSSAGAGNKLRPSPSVSRTNSREAKLQTKSAHQQLSSDAVDLVVEDHRAAEEGRTRDRRKGEPSVTGSALKKVYRRHFVSHVEGSRQGEVEADGPNREHSDAGKFTIGDKDEDASKFGSSISEARPDDGLRKEDVITRAETPPPHISINLDRYDLQENENPWA